MNELEEKVNGILSNPEEMRRISELARSLMGAQEQENTAADTGPDGPDPLHQKLLSRLGAARGTDSGNAAKLHNLSRCLDSKRAGKLERAIRMSEMARIAGAVLREYGGEADGDK